MSKILRYENQDCFDFLSSIEDKTIDLILIDPPYEISRKTNFQAGAPTGRDTDRFRISMDFGEWDNKANDIETIIKESYRILRNGGTFITFYDIWKMETIKNYLDKYNFKQIRFLEWVKTNPVPINSKINYLTNCREIAILGVKKSSPTFHSSYDNGIYNFPICQDAGRFHPTQKPIKLIEALIEKHSNENDIILDCFAGSGTTAVASLNLNRNFMGCEIDKDFYKKSCKRLEYNKEENNNDNK